MARLLYPDIGDCRALVIDGNMTSAASRGRCCAAMGVGHVAYASKVVDARRLLENRSFDVVLCDYHFDHSAMSGQDLFDDLRRSNLLPHATVFVMVTGEASYTRVAEAAEAALDSYLPAPHRHRAGAAPRCRRATARRCWGRSSRRSLRKISPPTRRSCARSASEQRGEYWLYAARVGAELWVRIERPREGTRPTRRWRRRALLPWLLGIARVEPEAQQQAERIAERLMANSRPTPTPTT